MIIAEGLNLFKKKEKPKMTIEDPVFGTLSCELSYHTYCDFKKHENFTFWGKERNFTIFVACEYDENQNEVTPITDKQRNVYKRFLKEIKSLDSKSQKYMVAWMKTKGTEGRIAIDMEPEDKYKSIKKFEDIDDISLNNNLFITYDGRIGMDMEWEVDDEHGLQMQLLPSIKVDQELYLY